MAESGSLTVYPSAYLPNESTTGLPTSDTNKPVGKGANNTSGYAQFKFSSVFPLTAVYGFDVSAIPANAEIDAVSCTAGVASTSGMNVTLRLYSGSTSIVSNTEYMVSGQIKKITVSGGAWTRDMLSAIRLVINQTSSTGTTQYTINFYGADLTVTYTYKTEKFMLKLSGDYEDVARVFKKVSGIWVEQTDLANVIEDGVRYQNGGEYVAPVRPASVTITGTGNSTYCYATINGTKHSGAASNIEVMPGDVITFGVYGRSSTYYGRVTIDGTQALNVTNQQTQTYNWTVPDGVKTISVSMSYTSTSNQRNGRITVTTTR